MNQLDKDLEKENEEQLLQCKYMYWSKNEKKTITKGIVKSFTDSGILDSRIIVEKGSSQLRGYLIMSKNRFTNLEQKDKEKTNLIAKLEQNDKDTAAENTEPKS
ncbi:hypothetical protein Glove_212g39 [Diversispora epigaea]|uniref:Uncharacterized protein n=1 Tax=Diversispora epigaea TaxID=1348612 RepID=A0A397II73_9GLOM|nr:hypothetical protein Glove_212g39 [Diversispora epigaea]